VGAEAKGSSQPEEGWPAAARERGRRGHRGRAAGEVAAGWMPGSRAGGRRGEDAATRR
jgi:hypothetical protein